jgi:hypothetical protein
MTGFLSFAGTFLLRALLFVSMASALEAQTIITFDPPDSTNTMPSAINLEGQITGNYFAGTGNPHGFLRKNDGTFVTFDVPLIGYPSNASPMDINAAGEIVGSYLNVIDFESFLRKRDGTLVFFFPNLQNEASTQELPQIGCLPFGDSKAVAINDLGQITVNSVLAGVMASSATQMAQLSASAYRPSHIPMTFR